jgi:epoxyqueuosine reductase
MPLADLIKQRALDLGFDLAGITPATPPAHVADYQRWLADGYHGEMGYMARRAEDRTDPTRLLAGAKSIIVVAMNYQAGTPHPGQPRLARYAWGTRDYHDLIGGKLSQLSECIREQGGEAKWYVDTGPILERDLAQRAGIGFTGKHTNLISLKMGNWLFLGSILTTLELAPDTPEKPHCGSCRRCIDVCPTNAIVAPYRLDARLCISYLTIELKGSIPEPLRPLIGDHLFGCDDCLEVCPWNRFARESPVADFRPRPLPSLEEFLTWDNQQFKSFFAGTPVERLKRRGFLRNVCVVLGNTGDRTALPALEHALQDVEPLVREHAAWAITRIQSRGARV